MDRKTKEMLQQYFAAPEPSGKRQFLRNRKLEKLSMGHMVQTQLHYISKRTWGIAFILFIIMFVLRNHLNTQWMGSIYAIIPFIVMNSLAESMRSYRYGMEELELAARFSLKSVVLSRMFILGVINLLFLILIASLTGNSFFVEMVYMLVPYLITSLGGLIIVRHFTGRDGTNFSFVFSAVVSVTECVISLQYGFLYELQNFWGWMVVCLVFLCLFIRESLRDVGKMEELVWN